MYLFNIMRELYETSPEGSSEYIISQYLLMNACNIDKISLTDVSTYTSISKSAVSKYFKLITNGNNFSFFKSSLSFELETIIIDKTQIKKDFIEYKKLLQNFHIDFQFLHEKASKLVALMLHANSIVFYGDISKKSYFDILINQLLLNKKDAKFIDRISETHNKKNIQMLKNQDLFIVINPNNTFYNFLIKANLSSEIFINFPSVKSQKVFIGKPSHPINDFITIGIEDTNNQFLNDILWHYFITILVLEYIEKIN